LMIRELSSFFTQIEENDEIRIVMLRGKGKSFCAGADLTWMKNGFTLSEQENLRESEELSAMFRLIYHCSKITVAVAHGNIFGGGNGLIAVCDLAYCVNSSKFCLSETRLGLAAASITPYLLKKMAASDLKELIFTAKNYYGEEAVKYGLLNRAFASAEELDLYLNGILEQMLGNGKEAIIESKRLINRLVDHGADSEMENIPGLLAKIRISKEAQEGFSAFLEKRKPNWLIQKAISDK